MNLAAVADRSPEVIWVDHHRSNPGLGTVPLIDPDASSTAEMAFLLMKRIGGEVPADAAADLYAGIVTDTGRFQYGAATPQTLRLAAELRETGFDHAALARALFEDGSLGYLKATAVALGRLVFDEDASMVWTYPRMWAGCGSRPRRGSSYAVPGAFIDRSATPRIDGPNSPAPTSQSAARTSCPSRHCLTSTPKMSDIDSFSAPDWPW